ncbi:MAG TPA: S24 family peptidase [Gemmatimonadaceae bacterium]|nr:S24 family peptidase [Gemmatimonadaceae bacterium]
MSDDERRDDRRAEAEASRAASARLRAEWEYDYLVQLAARAEMSREDSPFYTDAALVAWLDAESRTPERAATGWNETRVAEVAEWVRERAEAARLGVGTFPSAAPLRAADVVGTVPQVRAAAVAARCAPSIALAAAAGAGRELWDEPCDQWLQLPAGLGAGEYVAIEVRGDSMTPVFHTGDVILVRLGQRVERDTVVVARHPDDGYVVKRVGRVGRTALELTSLNPAFPPISVPRTAGAVVGTVVMRWQGRAGPAEPS